MAISAVLLLSTGMAHAQEAAPGMTIAQAPPAAPAIAIPSTPPQAQSQTPPTIILPAPADEGPVTAPVTAREAPTRATSPAPRAARREPEATPTAAQATAIVAPAASPQPAMIPPTPVDPVAASPASPVAENAQPTLDTPSEDSSDWAVPVGAAATLLVLGGVAFAATRRRRVWEADADFVPPVVPRPASRTAAERPAVAERLAELPPIMGTKSATTADERAELIDRMVASPPDAINPFTSRKARRRRARLIVQSMKLNPIAQAPVLAEHLSGHMTERPLQDHRALADA